MPKTFSTALFAELNRQYGSEPLLVVGIEWAAGKEILYSDQRLNDKDYPYPLIVNLSDFDTSTFLTGSGDTRTVTLTLSDIDGTLKTLIQEHDVNFSVARVYLCFQNLPITERAVMFEGTVNTDIRWDEGARTLTLEILNTLESSEAGFMMDDGDFPFIEPSQRNAAWPLVFGSVCNMKAVQLSTLQRGTLVEGQGVKDPTLEERLCQAQNLLCASYDEDSGIRSEKQDPICLARRFNEICKILRRIEEEEQWVNNTLTIRGGSNFPQNQEITIQIGAVKFKGVMSGDTFSIQETIHPDLERIDNPPCKQFSGAALGYRAEPGTGIPDRTGPANSGGATPSCGDVGEATLDIVEGAGESWRYYDSFQEGDFIWLPPGSDVVLADNAELVYIVSLIPGTVNQVAAYRTYGDTALLSEVPTDRYTVHTEDYGGYNVVEIRMDVPLSTFTDEKWSDDIYVSFTSNIGPNPMDTVLWLLSTYTDYIVDATSWAYVRTKLTNYPSNFWVKSRPDVLGLIQDIVYQCRCAAFIRNGVVYFKYLSEEPTALKTITDDDILINSLQISYTPTEDLITKHVIKWQEGEAGIEESDETEFSFPLKLNIPQYGVREEEFDYFTQNTFSTIEKSATFWMIRRANSWMFIEFETPIKHLDLDLFDAININSSAVPNTKAVIVESQYSIENNTIRFKCWTPILAGTSSPYKWAWPALQGATDVFFGGFGEALDITVTPPEGHPLRAGYDPDAARLATAGDRFPSDLDDVFPEVICKIATGVEIQDTAEPVFRPFEPLAEDLFAEHQDGIDVAVSAGDGDDNKEDGPDACGQPVATGMCAFEVIVQYVVPQTITTIATGLKGPGCLDGAPCKDGSSEGGGGKGMPCQGKLGNKCHRFGNMTDAASFLSATNATIQNLKANCGYQNGVAAPWNTLGIRDVSSQAKRDVVGDITSTPCGTGVDCGCVGTPPGSDEITGPGQGTGDDVGDVSGGGE